MLIANPTYAYFLLLSDLFPLLLLVLEEFESATSFFDLLELEDIVFEVFGTLTATTVEQTGE